MKDNIKGFNSIVYEYMGDDSCMCMVNNICPSPSSHSEYCQNEDCKKKITPNSWNPYAKNINLCIKVLDKMLEDEIITDWSLDAQSNSYAFHLYYYKETVGVSGKNINELILEGIATMLSKRSDYALY